eukprot:6472068-Amphidinium_carterae.3
MEQSLVPLSSVLVRYADDPALWHERVLLVPVLSCGEQPEREVWVVATPNRDVCVMDLTDPERFRNEFVLLEMDALPDRRARCYLCGDGDGGYTSEELGRLQTRAERLRDAERVRLLPRVPDLERAKSGSC